MYEQHLELPPPGGRGALKKVLYGEGPPRGSTLTLLYTIFFRKGSPLVYLNLVPRAFPGVGYTFYWKKAPLSDTFLKRLRNKSLKQEVFLSFFFT